MLGRDRIIIEKIKVLLILFFPTAENNGEKAVTRILSDEEYKKELFKKLLEESNEVINSTDSMLEELGDVLEVMIALAKTEDKSLDDIIEIANKKRIKRGGFEKKIYLVKTYKK